MNTRHLVPCAVATVGILTTVLSSSFTGQDLPVPARDIEITITEGTNFITVASPDRQWIAIDLLGALWVLPIRGGDARRVTPETIEARHPSWAPDGKSLAFQAYDDQAWHINTIGTDGSSLKAVTDGPFDDVDPDWSPDGRSILFSSDRFGGISTIWQLEVDTGAIRQLSAFRGNMPCWAAPGRPGPNAGISVWRNPASTRDVIFFGADPSARPDQPAAMPQWWILGPAGPVAPLSLVWPLPPAITNVTCESGRAVGLPPPPQLPGREDLFPFSRQWLTPGRLEEFIYTADGVIKRGGIRGNGVIPFTAKLTVHRPVYPPRHREFQPQTLQSVRGIVSPAVSPDGSRIAFVALGDLWLLPVGGTPFRLTNDAYVELDPAWSPDGGRLAFATDRGGGMDLWIRDFKTGVDTQITRDEPLVSGAAWSPDGEYIAYRTGRNTLEAIRLAPGGAADKLGTIGMGREPGRPTWAPGLRTLGFGRLLPYALGAGFPGGTNQLGVRSFDKSATTGEALVIHHSAGDRQSGGPVWSPDGFRIAYVSEGRLWTQLVDVNGKPMGAATLLSEDMSDSPSWEGDSRHLVYLTPDGLRRVAADGGSIQPITLDLGWLALPPPDRVVVHAGRLFDGKTSSILRSIDIVVEGGRIRDVAPHQDDRHVGRVIDASDETVMPGLIESAACLDPAYGEALGRVWLAYGITTVADPASDGYAVLEMRESYDAGRRMGPRLLVAGDPFAGIRVLEAGGVSIGSSLQLESALTRAKQLGFDFFSTYVRLPDQHHRRITAFAHQEGVAVVSPHLVQAAAFGADAVAPLRDLSRRGGSSRVSGQHKSYRDVIDVIAKSGMALMPALGAEGAFLLLAGRDKELPNDPRLGLFPASIAAGIRRAPDTLRLLPTNMLDAAELKIKTMGNTVAAIVAAGGRIVAGTNPAAARGLLDDSVPYGLGLHIEIEQFVKAGLRPFQALQTATMNAAEALGVADELGSIERGKLADLVFVDGDPLEDIRTTRNVTGVMRGGWYYDLPALGVRR